MFKKYFLILVFFLSIICLFEPSYSSTIIKRNSHARFIFVDADGNPVERNEIFVEIRYEPINNKKQSKINRYSVLVKSGEKIYFPLPEYPGIITVYVTSKNSSDYLIIYQYQYRNVVYSLLDFAYYASKTFKVDGSKRPNIEEIEKMEKKIEKNKIDSFSKINLNNESGNIISQSASGKTIIIDAQGFIESNAVEMLLDNKKLSSTVIAYSSFGLKFQIPKDIMPGKHMIKLQGNVPREKAEATLTIRP